jgi:hypothetical protein
MLIGFDAGMPAIGDTHDIVDGFAVLSDLILQWIGKN